MMLTETSYNAFPRDDSPNARRRLDRVAHNLCDAFAAALDSDDGRAGIARLAELCGLPVRVIADCDAEALLVKCAEVKRDPADAKRAPYGFEAYLMLFCDAWSIGTGSGTQRLAPDTFASIARACSSRLLGHAVAAYNTIVASAPAAPRLAIADDRVSALFAICAARARNGEPVPYVDPQCGWNLVPALRDR